MSETEKDVGNKVDKRERPIWWWALREGLFASLIGIVVSLLSSLVVPVLLTHAAPSLVFDEWPPQYKTYGSIVLVITSISIGLAVAYLMAKKWRDFKEGREKRLKEAMLKKEAEFLERLDTEFRAILNEKVS